MRKCMLAIYFGFILLSFSGIALAEEKGKDNLIKNHDFKKISEATGFPADWNFVQMGGKGKAELSKDSYSGKYSMKISYISGDKPNFGLRPKPIRLKEQRKRKFILKAFVKTSGDGLAFISYVVQDKNSKTLDEKYSPQYKNKNDWTELTFRFTVFKGAANLFILFRNFGKGDVWFDNISLTEDVSEEL